MRKPGRGPFVVALAVLAALAVAACGEEERGGGEITIAQLSQPDFLDPATSYTQNGWEPMWLVYTPLLAYPHREGAAGTRLIPGLAEDLPAISDGGRTYRLKLRDGLEYSNGAPVKASDFERTIQRVLNLESGGAAFYEGIVGAEEYEKAGRAEADIEGIRTDDETGEIAIELKQPDGTFSNVLAMNFAGLVPGDTPFRNLTKEPPPGVGPYKITRSVPNREFVMERNEGFSEIPGIPEGKIDKITTKIVKSPQRQTQDVIAGKLDYIQDPPPADLLPEVRSKHRDRYKELVTVSTYYFFMNTRVPPFDEPEVREAVNRGVDKRALARLFGGLLEPSCNFLPPGMLGYERIDPCPWGDPKGPPDVARARELIGKAGAEGAEVTVWGNTDDPTPKVTQAYADMLNRIGLEAKPKVIDAGVYFQTVGSQKTRAQTGFANWFQDFPHPANFMFLVSGESIQETNNQNFGNVEDPELTAGIERLKREPDLEAVKDEWAKLDRELVEGAYIVPYGHRKLATFMSERMDFESCSLVHSLYVNDYSSFCLK